MEKTKEDITHKKNSIGSKDEDQKNEINCKIEEQKESKNISESTNCPIKIDNNENLENANSEQKLTEAKINEINKEQNSEDNKEKITEQKEQKKEESKNMSPDYFNLQNMLKDPQNRHLYELYKRKEALFSPHQFWDTQPIQKIASALYSNETNCPLKKILPEEIKANPYNLPQGFEWVNVNITNEKELDELHQFLKENFVDSSKISQYYSQDFIKWIICNSNYSADLQIGVKITKTQKLVGFISGKIITIIMNKQELSFCEPHFLCIYHKLRGNRLAPVLIKELIRRTNLKGVYQGIYGLNFYLPMPFIELTTHRRVINVRKLLDLWLIKQ